MPLETDWLVDMGASTVNVEPFTGINDYGEPSYGAAVPYQGIVQNSRHQLFTADGRVEQSQAVLFLFTTSGRVTLQDRVTFAGSTEPMRLMRVDPTNDDTGQHHLEVLLG